MGLPQGYTQHRAGVTIGEPRGVHADGHGLGKARGFADGSCKFRVRKVADDACVAPMVGAEGVKMATTPTTLNQSQQREVSRVLAYLPHLGADYAARALSALHRSALRASQQRELLAIGLAYGLVSRDEWK